MNWQRMSDRLEVKFAPQLSAYQAGAVLIALADYYRACGGIGLQIDFDLADVLVEEPADVLA